MLCFAHLPQIKDLPSIIGCEFIRSLKKLLLQNLRPMGVKDILLLSVHVLYSLCRYLVPILLINNKLQERAVHNSMTKEDDTCLGSSCTCHCCHMLRHHRTDKKKNYILIKKNNQFIFSHSWNMCQNEINEHIISNLTHAHWKLSIAW